MKQEQFMEFEQPGTLAKDAFDVERRSLHYGR